MAELVDDVATPSDRMLQVTGARDQLDETQCLATVPAEYPSVYSLGPTLGAATATLQFRFGTGVHGTLVERVTIEPLGRWFRALSDVFGAPNAFEETSTRARGMVLVFQASHRHSWRFPHPECASQGGSFLLTQLGAETTVNEVASTIVIDPAERGEPAWYLIDATELASVRVAEAEQRERLRAVVDAEGDAWQYAEDQ